MDNGMAGDSGPPGDAGPAGALGGLFVGPFAWMAGLAGLFTLGWSYVQFGFSKLIGCVIVNFEVKHTLYGYMLRYLNDNAKPYSWGSRVYDTSTQYIKPLDTYGPIGLEIPGRWGILYLMGRHPVWLRVGENGCSVTFIRGTATADALVQAAIDYEVQLNKSPKEYRRYTVVKMFGSAGKPPAPQSTNEKGTLSGREASLTEALNGRLLRYTRNDLGQEPDGEHPLDRLALADDARELIEDIRLWKESQEWYVKREIPWRLGVGLFGPPGTGKTSLVQGIGFEHNLPIYHFCLPSYYNDEFCNDWRRVLNNSPAIVLFEDITAAFREKDKAVGGQLTLDTLQNCIDGVERATGLLIFMTSNHPEELDEALIRDGRIDYKITMGVLDAAGAEKIGRRILCDWPELLEEAIESGTNMSGASFQKLCIRLAKTRRLAERQRQKTVST